MRILHKGVTQSSKEYVKKCPDCKSILIYNDIDIIMDMSADSYIRCPVCAERIYIWLFKRKYKEGKKYV